MTIMLIRVFLLWRMFLVPQVSGERLMTLEEAVSTALARNPEILRAQKELEAAGARRLQQSAYPFPELVFRDEGLSLRDDAGDREISFGLEQDIVFPGKRALRKEVSGYDEEIAAAELERAKRLLAAGVKKAFFQTFYSQKVLESTNGLLDVLRQYQEMAATRFEAGHASSLDILRGRLESLKVQGELIEAGRALRENQASLSRLLGQDGVQHFTVAGGPVSPPLGKELETLRREAESRPSLRAAALRVEQAGAAVRLARKNAWPDFRVGLYYPSLRTSAWGFSVGTTIPLWRSKVRGEISEAEAQNQAMSAALVSRRQKILLFLQSAYADVKSSEEQLLLFERSVLGESENLLQNGISQYQYGKIDSLNLFDLYRLYKTARLEYLGALRAHEISLAELEIAGEED
jgi:cobalt-zinc-cadmium efflux system outer membrane protein